MAGQGLVVRNYQRGLIQSLNDIGHGKGLAGTRHPQQSLELVAFLEPLHQFGDCRGLVPGGFVFGMKFERFLFNTVFTCRTISMVYPARSLYSF